MEEHITKKLRAIMFGILSPTMVKDMAAAKVVTPELYDKEGYPVDGGLMDVRLGVIDPGLRCKTCGCRLKECIGHFGYIQLARPVVHIKFAGIILDLMRSTCRECGNMLIPKDKIAEAKGILDHAEKEGGLSGRRRAIKDILSELKTITKCPHCNAKQQKVKGRKQQKKQQRNQTNSTFSASKVSEK